MKKSNRGLSKKGLRGLQRVGNFPKRKWLYMGKEFDTLREVVYASMHSGKNQD